VSWGEAAAVEGEESFVVEVTVLLRRLRWDIAVDAILKFGNVYVLS
jgi:ubiquinone biosynthesis protein UbiJ